MHWDATGTTLADASTQWCSSGDAVLTCIIGTHWKSTGNHWNHTGTTLEQHWPPTILSPVAFQCTLGSKFQVHWIATGRPLAQGKGPIVLLHHAFRSLTHIRAKLFNTTNEQTYWWALIKTYRIAYPNDYCCITVIVARNLYIIKLSNVSVIAQCIDSTSIKYIICRKSPQLVSFYETIIYVYSSCCLFKIPYIDAGGVFVLTKFS